MKLGSVKIETIRSGFLTIKKAVFSYIAAATIKPPTPIMEYMERGDAVSVLVKEQGYGGSFILVKQFRIGNYIREDQSSSYSTVAGTVDEGETDTVAAIREMLEEIGVAPKELTKLGTFYTSPGGTTERVTYFFAEVSPESEFKAQDTREVHEIVKLSESDFRDKIRKGEISSNQAVTAFLLAEELWCF